MSDVSQSPDSASDDDRKASEELLPLVYAELRKLAAAWLVNERPGQTLQPTALVHEAYLRLQGGGEPQKWANRAHFFRAAAVAIRRILVENARRKSSWKRGGGRARLSLDDARPALPEPREDLLALDEALQKLAGLRPQAAELVELRYFGGLTVDEAAEALGVAPRTAGDLWKVARAFLRSEVEG